MTIKSYGTWSAEGFQSAVTWFRREQNPRPRDIEEDMEELKEEGHYESFKEAFKQFLLDDSLTLAQKNELYLENTFSSDWRIWDCLKCYWEIIAPGEPWPLEGRPAPEKPQ